MNGTVCKAYTFHEMSLMVPSVPNDEEIAFVLEILDRIVAPLLDQLEGLLVGTLKREVRLLLSRYTALPHPPYLLSFPTMHTCPKLHVYEMPHHFTPHPKTIPICLVHRKPLSIPKPSTATRGPGVSRQVHPALPTYCPRRLHCLQRPS